LPPQVSANNTAGIVYSLSTAGTETILHNFGSVGDDGVGSNDGLINVNGVLYGTTRGGGSMNKGTVFSVTTSGIETVLYSFGTAGDGAIPFSGLVEMDGVLYGTTYAGGVHNGGTIFSITPAGVEKVLHSFADGQEDPNGNRPTSDLVALNGLLYGTLEGGGPNGRGGTLVSVTINGKVTLLHAFQHAHAGPDGSIPAGALVNYNGTLYGITSDGGTGGKGAIYSYTP